MPSNIPQSSSSSLEDTKENKGNESECTVIIMLDTINGFRYYLGDESRAIEEQTIERRVYVPWTSRANEVLATWIGIQMSIFSCVHC